MRRMRLRKVMVDGWIEGESWVRHRAHLHGGHQLFPVTSCQLAVANVPDHEDTATWGLLQVETVSSGTVPTEW